ncbi:MAG: SdpI family protein [Acidobacteria bacterium]|nr:SdpI family protein [Acidobacteriota bacterium]
MEENEIEILVAILTAASLLIIALAVPMIRRRVPPNTLYGLRVPATFADDSVWYDANEQSGRDLLIFGVILLVVAVGLPIAAVSSGAYGLIWSGLAVAGAIAVAIVGWRRANRLLRDRQIG